ncbi:MAG: outer membrane protein transport protein [Parvibaculum sp.]|uniref:OmpP1/FadL family transporter n=1 Tax=Parvibaculum sp. TaxID=2024848 RepID=UPI0025DBA045|nr:porin [Parvibaculum sp.]MCE9649230.1 outer membrane protein transport protein [Parvibaculum sp.]
MSLSYRRFRRIVGLVAASTFVVQSAHAAGFAVHEQSAASQGNAYAGVAAGGDDISSSFFNPATLSLYPGIHLVGSFSVVDGRADFSPESATTAFGTPITGGDGGDLIKTGYVPAFTGSWQVSPEWFLGLSVNAPYGFETEGDGGWVGRYHALGSKLRGIEIDPMLAWKPAEWISFGAGFRAMKLSARLSSNIDIGTASAAGTGIPIFPPGDPANDSVASIKGDDWAYGYTFGVLLTPMPDTRVGIGYRSKMDVTLRGTADFTLSPAGQLLSTVSGQLVDTGATAAVTTPETVTLGIQHDLSPQWTIGAEADWTRWSRFQQIRVQFDNPLQADDVTQENWKDSWFLALGATYRPTEDWTLRAGVAYDQGVIKNDAQRGPRIPDSDRYWASLGAGYKLTEATTINAGYSHIFAPETRIAQSTSDPNNQVRGNLNGTVDAFADIVSLGVAMTF